MYSSVGRRGDICLTVTAFVFVVIAVGLSVASLIVSTTNTGPAGPGAGISGTDNHVVRMDGTNKFQSSIPTISDTGELANVLSVTVTDTLAVLGAATFTTIHATGAVTWDSTVSTGPTTVTTLHATDVATMDSTLTVTGASTLGVLSAGITTVSTLTATANSTFSSAVTVSGNLYSQGRLAVTSTTTMDDELVFRTLGKGISVKTGTNARMGRATLSGGAAVVATTAVTAVSDVFITSNVDGGTPGWLRVSTRTGGTSFTITSSSGTDTSIVAWLIVEPSP